MDAITIPAAPRQAGKQGAKAARRQGQVPCVLYGHHVEPVTFQVPELALKPLIYTAERHVVRIELDGSAWEAVTKAIDFHPVTDRPIHVDFQALQRGEKLILSIPVQFHGTPVGQREGGDTQILAHELQIRVLPKDIPTHIDVEIGELQIGQAIHVRDLDVPGVEFIDAPDKTVVAVVPPRGGLGLEEEAAPATGEAEGAEPAEEE